MNTSISGMMSSSSHILFINDLLYPLRLENKACYSTSVMRSHGLNDLRKRLLICERVIFRQQGVVEDHIGLKENRNTNKNATPTSQYKGSFKMRIQFQNVKAL